jgi:D-glycero-D-manno-heptose 1,7-bisphosphate phosphatase
VNSLPSAVFLDRDGTIIEDAHYLSDPDKVVLIHGAADAISRINAALVPVILVTNQSGIGRGYFTEADYRRVTERLDEMLARKSARIDAAYYCPHAPSDNCDCRKPGVGLFRQAAADHPDIDLARSLYVGDRMRDIQPGITLGGTAVLVPSADTTSEDLAEAKRVARVANSLGTVIDWYLCTN